MSGLFLFSHFVLQLPQQLQCLQRSHIIRVYVIDDSFHLIVFCFRLHSFKINMSEESFDLDSLLFGF